MGHSLHLLLLVLDRGERDLLESGLHALAVLGRRGQVLDLGVFGEELLHRRVLDLALLLAVDLVADQDEGELLGLLGRALVEELGDPGLDVVEGLRGGRGTRLLVMS